MNSNNINQGEKGVALNKFLADAGICSRRNAEKFIKEGLVTVNGQKITNPAHRIIEKDAVKYNNKLIKNSKKVYILLNKPKGYLCTLNDETGRKNVTDLVEGATKERIYPVGRLDMDTTGLIIMTNDGELTQRLAHPKYNIKKVYIATLHKPLEESHLQEFKKGVVLVDGPIKPDNIKLLGHAPSSHVLVELHSGRNRIVRRMFEHFGYFVDKLERTQYAFLKTQDLEVGKWRRLTGQEVDELKKQSYASKETPIPKKISNIIKAKKAKLELERRNETTKETKLQNCSSGCCSTKPGSFNKPKRNQQEYLKDQELNEKKWIKATGQNEENYIETDLPDFSDFGSRDSDSKPSRLKSSEFRKPDYRRNRSDRPASRYGSSRPDFRKPRSDRFESGDSEFRKPRYSDSGDSDSRSSENRSSEFRKPDYRRNRSDRPASRYGSSRPDFRKPRSDRFESGDSEFRKPRYSDSGDSDSRSSENRSSEFRKPDYRRNRSDRPASRYGSSRPDFRKPRSDRFESGDSEFRKPRYSDSGDSDSRSSENRSSEFRKPDYRRNRSDRPASRYGSSRPDFRKPRSDRFESGDSEFRKPRYSDSGDSDSRSSENRSSEFRKPDYRRNRSDRPASRYSESRDSDSKPRSNRSRSERPGSSKPGQSRSRTSSNRVKKSGF